MKIFTERKAYRYRVFSGLYVPVFGLNMEIYFSKSPYSVRIVENMDLKVNFRIPSEYRKIPTRKNSVFGHFSRSACKPCVLSIKPTIALEI